MNILITIGTEILNSPFYSALASSFIVSGIIGLLLPSYLLYLKRPKKLEFLFTESGKDEINFIINNQDNFKYSLKFSFKNSSKGASFKDAVYWHLFIPKYLNTEVIAVEDLNKSPFRTEAGEDYEHFSGSTNFPIYPELTRSLGYQFDIRLNKFNNLKSYSIYYYFGTEFGLYPSNVKIPLNFKDCNKMNINFNK